MFNEFKKFALKDNVIDMAVGINSNQSIFSIIGSPRRGALGGVHVQ
jgi:large-conductance mechanosensitive channel